MNHIYQAIQKDPEVSWWSKSMISLLDTLDTKEVISGLTMLLMYFKHKEIA